LSRAFEMDDDEKLLQEELEKLQEQVDAVYIGYSR
jgi:hypothetical protein